MPFRPYATSLEAVVTRYIAQRLLLLIPVLLGVSIVTFSLLRFIPGDPAVVMLGEHATPEQIERFREKFGLNDPIYVQYARYLESIVRLEFGRSIRSNEWVSVELAQRLPATIELTMGAMFIASIVGITAGIIAAYRHNTVFDLATMIGALIGVSMPVFWLGLLLAYLFGFKLRWLPPSGRLTVGIATTPFPEVWNLAEVYAGPGHQALLSLANFLANFQVLNSLLTGNWPALIDSLKHLILPSVALGTIPMAIIARMTRSSLLEVLGQDYIRTARAKGLREQVVLFTHAMKNAFLPIITIIGLQFGYLFSGAPLTETIFSWPGMGKLMVDRIFARDYPLVQGSVLVIAFLFVFINLLVDISYAYLDPRIRYE